MYSTKAFIGSTNIEISMESSELVFKIAGTEYARITTGHLIPPGIIVPYSGTSAPSQWLLCDGSTVSRITYARLFTAIASIYGNGDGSNTFHVPDLRGRFLRGLDNASGRDPDSGSRTAMNSGGNTGDNIGSVQLDAFQGHRIGSDATSRVMDRDIHASASVSVTKSGIYTETIVGNNSYVIPQTDGTNGNPRMTSETRSLNAYVNFLIKT